MTDLTPPTASDQEPRREGFLSTELADTATHAIGLGLSIAGLAVLVVLATKYGTARHIVACSVYGGTLVFLYLTSTLYHSVERTRVEPVFRLFDHVAIFLLIAGTYTPFTVVTLRGGWGWSLFGVIWGLAALGILYTLFFSGRFKLLRVAIYLGMGWLCVIAVRPMLDALPTAGIAWLLAGGLAYSAGVVFYLWKSIPHHHAIWHLFVMIGSACHFFSVMFFVVPRG